MDSGARPLKHYPPDLDSGNKTKRPCLHASPSFTGSQESGDLECESRAGDVEGRRHRDRSPSGGVICFGMVSTASGLPFLL